MATEEQTQYNTSIIVSVGTGAAKGSRQGQRLIIPKGRKVSSLSFVLSKTGTPEWIYSFHIYRVSDDALLAQTADQGDSGLTTVAAWYTHNLITPYTFTEDTEVRIIVYHTAGVGTVTVIKAHYQNTDVKAGEYRTRYEADTGPWYEYTTEDFAYKYEWASSPTVTTQLCRDIRDTSAKGYGNITELGAPDPTAHGHCWNTTGTPTTGDPKTDHGAKSAIGPFASEITGLAKNTTYYVRAYATNAYGTAYGNEVSFTTGGSPDCWYHLNVKNINLPYEDLDRTKELHVVITNLSPTVKLSGEYGKVKVKIDYEPAA